MLHPKIAELTKTIADRSQNSRSTYLKKLDAAKRDGRHRATLSCGNLAHGFAACGQPSKDLLSGKEAVNLGIVSAYNDMLSAHQPFAKFPNIIKKALQPVNAVAQFAGGVPAMCDGVTQGQPGMELSLFSRDVIALSTAVALSHNMFDGALCLGVCDKIVPGLFIGALSFGHLPIVFVPAGPMPSGLPNPEKAKVRQLFSEGKVGREELLEAESKSYHAPGTCTFYGTANSNQMLMELMGLHIPGASFVNPGQNLRRLLTEEAARVAAKRAHADAPGMGYMLDERHFVNGMVGLMATGGSTNLAIHLIAMARAAGILINWTDFDVISSVTPLLIKVYPNGPADVNHFHQAGGLAFLIRELMSNGLIHGDVDTVWGKGLDAYTEEPYEESGQLKYRKIQQESGNLDVLRSFTDPFQTNGGLKLLAGNIGRAIIKTSAVKPENRMIHAPAKVFHDQNDLIEAFEAGRLEGDFIAVIRFQGPRSNGMPELHKLTPILGVLQDRGQKVGLVTDGRMSGASGKVPAAIHVTPEAACGGAIAKIREGDLILLNPENGILEVEADLSNREVVSYQPHQIGMGRELFSGFRHLAQGAELGASVLFGEEA